MHSYKIEKLSFGFFFVCLIFLTPISARAACMNPAGTEAQIVYSSAQNVPMYCNGTTWIAMGHLNPGAGGSGCATVTMGIKPEGHIFYNMDHHVLQYCDGDNWRAVGVGTVGGGFLTFPDKVDESTSTVVESNILQVRVSGSASISIVGDGTPEYRICEDESCAVENHTWASTAGTIDDGEFLQLRLTSAGSPSTTRGASVTVGGGGDHWEVTTTGPDTTPDAFSFTDQTGVALSTLIESNTVTITGIDTAANVSISGDGSPEFRIAGGSWVTSGTITSGQTLQLRLTSSAANNNTSSATVTVGTVNDQWDVTTAGADPCAGSPSPGDVCADGSVYAGLSPDGNVPMYTTPADAGQYSWNNGTTNWIDTAMANNSYTTGEANTTLLVGLSDAASPYAAAVYCDGLSAHGQTDWYLPARDELNVLYTNRAAIGGFNTSGSFPAGSYWSSSESNIVAAWFQGFSDGYQDSNVKDLGLSVRCVRR